MPNPVSQPISSYVHCRLATRMSWQHDLSPSSGTRFMRQSAEMQSKQGRTIWDCSVTDREDATKLFDELWILLFHPCTSQQALVVEVERRFFPLLCLSILNRLQRLPQPVPTRSFPHPVQTSWLIGLPGLLQISRGMVVQVCGDAEVSQLAMLTCGHWLFRFLLHPDHTRCHQWNI